MKTTGTTPATIGEYIATFPRDVQTILRKIRAVVRRAAPEAEEIISYRMPAFRQKGILVYFAAFKNHIGLFPPVSGDAGSRRPSHATRERRETFGSPSTHRFRTI